MADPAPVGCLAGVRVLDLSQYLPGPYATQILADLGADVVKVEPPAGDPMRGIGPRDADGVSAFYKLINAGKTVVRVDLKSSAGKRRFTDLLDAADVLLESFRPGVLARLGFAAEALRALHPRLVHCALSGFGQDGPAARRAGHDISYMALAGGLATSGIAARPIVAHPPTADFASGLQAALAIVAALLRRANSGAGATIDLSIAESVLAWQGLVLTGARRPGHEAARAAALLNGGAACYQIYETADARFLALGALEEKFWAAFCQAIGRGDWATRQWEALPQHALIGEVAALIRTRAGADWAHVLADVDCCAQLVLEPAEVIDDPHIRARGLVTATTAPDPRVEVLYPARFDGAPPTPRSPVAEADAETIIRAWLDG
jgi:crotonobetainyl-CoA:carnitine CoA-transferase CaiB-like acyl-CoA transferase